MDDSTKIKETTWITGNHKHYLNKHLKERWTKDGRNEIEELQDKVDTVDVHKKIKEISEMQNNIKSTQLI